jgi:hypothetical protein
MPAALQPRTISTPSTPNLRDRSSSRAPACSYPRERPTIAALRQLLQALCLTTLYTVNWARGSLQEGELFRRLAKTQVAARKQDLLSHVLSVRGLSGRLPRTMALRMVRILRATAMKAIIFGSPAASSR